MEVFILWIIVGLFSILYSIFNKIEITLFHIIKCLLTGPYVLINLTCRD